MRATGATARVGSSAASRRGARATSMRAKVGAGRDVVVDVHGDESHGAVAVAGEPRPRMRATVAAATLSALVALTLADGARAAKYDATFDDPVEPFTIYGTVEKQFAINVMDESGRKIIGRRRGMTATACANVVPASSIPGNGRPPRALRAPACSTATVEGEITSQKQMLPACAPACKASCSAGLQEYIDGAKVSTGFGLGKEQREKVMRACLTTCGKDCTKSGKFYDFIIPFRF